jgi:hypothetical protein
MEPGLPFVDEHARRITAPRDAVWTALESYADGMARHRRDAFRALLGTEPPAGFAVDERVAPSRLTLAGGHRFSRYELVFVLTATEGDATRLAARTYAAFPGLRGRLYRGVVLGSGAHAAATRRMLRAVEALATRRPAP